MTVNRVAFGALAVACVVAAGGGAYVALRHNDRMPSTSQAAAGEREAAPRAAPILVTETEAIVAEAPAAPVPVTETEAILTTSPAKSAPVAGAPAPRSAGRPAAGERPRATTPESAPRSAAAPATAPAPSATETPRVIGLDRPWPSSAAGEAAGSTPQPPAAEPEPAAEPAPEAQPPCTVEIPQRQFEDLIVPADSVIGLQMEAGVSSETARVEDRVRARVTRDVKVGDNVAIPAGSRAEGSITLVDRGGKFKERARLGIRFHTIVLADGTQLTLNTDPVYRDGASPSGESAAKVGGAAVGGAILGAILGGTRGAVAGGAAGAAGGAVAVATGDRNEATLPAGAMVTVRLTSPATVTIEK